MSNRMALQVARVDPGLRKNLPHLHRAAELLFIIDHPVQTQIEGTSHRAQTGDLIFVESDVPHSINTSSPEGGTYLSIQF
ncbi:cupin domain-containing protein [Spirosoma telluris]|uniref:cupin domain-containing protein n=1 Tax=Spirosoma telluris TaxID=2183553 RepID=UPI002FC33F9F